MPWRKDWIDPAAEEWQGEEGAALLRSALEKRAYEVWISEISAYMRAAIVVKQAATYRLPMSLARSAPTNACSNGNRLLDPLDDPLAHNPRPGRCSTG